MTNTDELRAAAQQALVALVHHTEQTRPIQRTADAIAALRAALAQQPAADHVPAGPDAEAATDAKLGLVLLPPIRVDRATHAALQEAARARSLIVQAIVRERLAPYAIPGAAPQLAHAQPEAVEALAHRIAWRYKKSSDPAHSDTYTFNRSTLLQFAQALQPAPARVPLTDAQVLALQSHYGWAKSTIRAIEAEIAATAKQEPKP